VGHEEEQMRRIAVQQFPRAIALRRTAHASGNPVDFDAAGMRWLDTFISEEAASGDQGRINTAYWQGGAFYGECLLRTLGGHWYVHDEMTMVRFEVGNGTFPFNTVLKQLDGEDGASVVGAFTSAVSHFAASATPKQRQLGASRQWWGDMTIVDGEAIRYFTPTSGTAAEIIDGAFNIVRHGDSRAVSIHTDACGLTVLDLVHEFNTNWRSAVLADDPMTVCGYTSEPAAWIELAGEGQRVPLVDRPVAMPSTQGRDRDRFNLGG